VDGARASGQAAPGPLAKGRTFERAQDLHRKGYLPEAEMLYREILQRSPRRADAMNSLGILYAQRGDQASALKWLAHAIATDSRSATYCFNYGKALLQAGRAAEACEALERAASLDSGYAAAYHELGRAKAEAGNAEGAEEAFLKALSLDSGAWETYSNFGLFLHGLGRNEDAESSLRKAVEIEPRSVDALRNLGMVLRARGQASQAVDAYRAALALRPRDAATLSNLGNALVDLSRRDEAIACFRDALAAAPEYADAQHNWGLLHLRSGEFQAAAERFRAALAIDPRSAEAEKGLASALHDLGHIEEAIGARRRTLALRPDDKEAHSQLLFSLLHSPEVAPRLVFEEHREWARRHASGLSPATAHDNPAEPERRLRVGYVSGDFRHHSVAQFAEPVLARHDRTAFEVFCYYNLRHVDETTDRLRRNADCWREIATLDDTGVAELVRADRIDILVDLSGHTRFNRLLVFARKPAPVQATWLGYPGTSGLDAIGYRITDGKASPQGFDALHSERLVRLPHSQWCYQSPRECPDVTEPPSVRSGAVTLGAFSSLAKIGPRVIELWSKLLERLADARLMVVGLGLESMNEEYRARFAEGGVAPDRIELRGFQSFRDYLTLHGSVDLMLDTFPYTGGTTTCHALWMGVPVVSLAGDATPSRGGASLLDAIGLDELVADTPEAYLSKASSLASDRGRLSTLRSGMRERMSASPLMDAAGFTRDLERGYRDMWRRWCSTPGAGG
jgi:predicted O-linked N-acetylglucosamine transferase (SPINDLY family)